MAFTGTPGTVERITERLYRVTGLGLAGAASGTIGLTGGTGEVTLPGTDDWTDMGAATLIDAVQVTMNPVTSVTTLVPIMVVKTGTTNNTFLITFTNTTAATASATLEIYIELR